MPNWLSGILFGWLLAAIGTRLFEVDWSTIRPRAIQFSLMRLIGSMSLVAVALTAALRVPPFIRESAQFATTVSIATVCTATAVGLLIGQARRFAYYAAIVMAALSAAAILEAIATSW